MKADMKNESLNYLCRNVRVVNFNSISVCTRAKLS